MNKSDLDKIQPVDRPTPPAAPKQPWQTPQLKIGNVAEHTMKLSFLSEGTHFGGS